VRILVTGGAGFIGSHLGERLLNQGHKVACVDNFDDYYDPALKRRNLEAVLGHPQFALYEVDIRDKKALQACFRTAQPEAVIHLAARPGVRASAAQPQVYVEVNVLGTANVLECCRHEGVSQVLFGSSSSVYGGRSSVPFREEDPVAQPLSPYAATKQAGELLCYTYHHLYGLNVTCLRFFSVYGPRQRPDMAVHKFARLIDAGQEVPIYGDGSSRRDYTYVDDIVEGILRALEKPLEYEIINLGGARTVELSYLIHLLEENLGRPARLRYLSPQPGEMPITYADISKARRLLDYNPQTGIEEGIARFVEWYRKRQWA